MTLNNYVLREWDSNFFNRNILDVARSGTNGDKRPTKGLVTTKITAEDLKNMDLLGANGFRFCEGETLLSKKLTKDFCDVQAYPIKSQILMANSDDIVDIQNIVEGLYNFSRFREPWFSESDRNSFYKEWARKAILGLYDDFCIIIKDEQEKTSGFITLKISDSLATIGLLGVSPSHQRKGVGKQLLQYAEVAASIRGVKQLNVATQTSNLGAIHLYQKSGYSVSEISFWLYKQL